LSVRGTAIVLSLIAALAAGCGGGGDSGEVQLPPGCREVEAPPAKQVDLKAPSRRLRGPATAVVETSCGSFEIALDVTRAPRTTSSFAYLVKRGVYDGTQFHQIVPGFVIQGGDPKGDGTGGPGYFIDELPPQNLSYTRGVVAMAESPAEPPGRSGSQFFVVTAADAGLAPDNALLGRVSRGFDVVRRIQQLGSADGTPRAPVVIERVSLRGG
jgi:peptidyl-prolyl cis-trans isomerase B (cyclophilin B)